MIVVLTPVVAVLSMKEQVVNVPEPAQMRTAPPACSKMKERPKKETEELQIYIKVYVNIQYAMIYMKEDDDCRVKEKNNERRKNNDDQLLHQKIF